MQVQNNDAISACGKGEQEGRLESEPKRRKFDLVPISIIDQSNSIQSHSNSMLPEGLIIDVSLHEQLLFDQLLRGSHSYALWEYLAKFGMEATNAAHSEFVYKRRIQFGHSGIRARSSCRARSGQETKAGGQARGAIWHDIRTAIRTVI